MKNLLKISLLLLALIIYNNSLLAGCKTGPAKNVIKDGLCKTFVL